MADHIEWGDAGYMLKFSDVLTADQANEELHPDVECEKGVLVLDTGSSVLAIDGTGDEIVALAARIHELGMALKHIETRPAS